MSPGCRSQGEEERNKEEGKMVLSSWIPLWGPGSTCTDNPFEGRQAGAFVPQVSSLLAGDFLPGWDSPTGKSHVLLDSGVSTEAEQQRDTEAHTRGGATSM